MRFKLETENRNAKLNYLLNDKLNIGRFSWSKNDICSLMLLTDDLYLWIVINIEIMIFAANICKN